MKAAARRRCGVTARLLALLTLAACGPDEPAAQASDAARAGQAIHAARAPRPGPQARERAQAPVGVAHPARALERARRLADQGRFGEAAGQFARAAQVAMSAGGRERARELRALLGLCQRLGGQEAEGDAVLEGVRAGLLPDGSDPDRTDRQLGDLDRTAELALQAGVPWVQAWALERAARAALDGGDALGAVSRVERALALVPGLGDRPARLGSLQALRARARHALGDDEGAEQAWRAAAGHPGGRLGRARLLASLGRHEAAADLAWEALRAFEAGGYPWRAQRDEALGEHARILLAAGRLDDCARTLGLAAGSEQADHPALRLLRARLSLAHGAWLDAADELGLEAAAGDSADTRALRVVSLWKAGRRAQALAVLEALPASTARTWLQVLLTDRGPGAGDPPDRGAVAPPPDGPLWPDDGSARRLGDLCPAPLPGRAWAALDRARSRAAAQRRPEDARRSLADGVQEALLVQASERLEAVTGTAPAGALLEAGQARLRRWVAGGLGQDQVLVAVVPGPERSYLVLCTREGIRLAPCEAAPELRQRALRLALRLRRADAAAVSQAGAELYQALFGPELRVALQGRRHWTLLWPDELMPAPPALLVSAPARPGSPPRWLVRDVTLGLLPHALAGLAAEPGAPGLHPAAGDEVLRVASGRAFDLRRQLARAGSLVLSRPLVAGQRGGGLSFEPDPRSFWVDEAGGFLPWHRLVRLPLPPLVVFDRTRFALAEGEADVGWAATAALVRCREALFSSWGAGALGPAVVQAVLGVVAEGVPLATALARVQRRLLELAEQQGRSDLAHPRAWASWLAFSGR